MESARHSFGHTRLQSPTFTKFADHSNVSVVAGRSLMYKLKRVGASTDPCGRPTAPSRTVVYIIFIVQPEQVPV